MKSIAQVSNIEGWNGAGISWSAPGVFHHHPGESWPWLTFIVLQGNTSAWEDQMRDILVKLTKPDIAKVFIVSAWPTNTAIAYALKVASEMGLVNSQGPDGTVRSSTYVWIHYYAPNEDILKGVLSDSLYTILQGHLWLKHANMTRVNNFINDELKPSVPDINLSGVYAVYHYESVIAVQYAVRKLLENNETISGSGIATALTQVQPPLITTDTLSFTNGARNFKMALYNFMGPAWSDTAVVGSFESGTGVCTLDTNAIQYPWGDNVVLPFYSGLKIGIMVPTSVQFGPNMTYPHTEYVENVIVPSIYAAVDYINSDDSVLPGFVLYPFEDGDPACSGGAAIHTLSSLLAKKPLGIIGPYCSSAATHAQTLAEYSNTLMVSYGASMFKLPSSGAVPSFLRTALDEFDHVAIFQALKSQIRVDWLGALTSAAYEDLALELSMMTTGTGKFLPARVDSAGVTTVQLRELEQAKISLVLVRVDDDLLTPTVITIHDQYHLCNGCVSNVSAPIFYVPYLDNLLPADTGVGSPRREAAGLFSSMIGMNTTSSGYETYASWLAQPNQQLHDSMPQRVNTFSRNLSPSIEGAFAWNSVIALANGIDDLFKRNIFPSNLTFNQELTQAIRAEILEGAGLDISFKGSSFDFDWILQNVLEDGTLRWLGNWNKALGIHNPITVSKDNWNFLKGINWVNGVPPSDPEVVGCQPGYRQVDPYTCAKCALGKYTPKVGMPYCTSARTGTYVDQAGQNQTIECPEGTTTYVLGATSIKFCRPKTAQPSGVLPPQQYFVNAPSITYPPVGCFADALGTDGLESNVFKMEAPGAKVALTLSTCNAACVSDGFNNERNYTFIALRHSDDIKNQSCLCGINLNEGLKVADSECAVDMSGCSPSKCCIQDKMYTQKCTKKRCSVNMAYDECGSPSTYSAYGIVDINALAEELEPHPCPTVLTGTGEEAGARCSGTFMVPYAEEGYWAPPKAARRFYKCFHHYNCQGGRPLAASTDETVESGSGVVLAECKEGARGRLCAGCIKGYFKLLGLCNVCPDISWGWIVYLFAPVFMLLGWNPFFKHVIGNKITPSLFVTYAYIQILAVIGMMTLSWPKDIQSVLDLLQITNFDFNLLLLDCWMKPPFIAKWIMFEMLPVFYVCFYMGRYYFSKIVVGDHTPTLGDRGLANQKIAKSVNIQLSYQSAFTACLFLVNMLFLAMTNKSLIIFMCLPMADGSYYLEIAANVTCYEGMHIINMILALLTTIIYTVGWPLYLCVIFYNGYHKDLLDNPQYAATYGFIYKRYEHEYFMWHLMVVFHKFTIVIIKVFLNDSLFQGAAGLFVTSLFILAHVYSFPFESGRLDRMQVGAFWSELMMIILGMMFTTEMGSGALQGQLKVLFYALFFGMLFFVLQYIYLDIERFYQIQTLQEWAEANEVPMQKGFRVAIVYQWFSTASEDELELFKVSQEIAERHIMQMPTHLELPFVCFAKESREVLTWLLWVRDPNLNYMKKAKWYHGMKELLLTKFHEPVESDLTSKVQKQPLEITSIASMLAFAHQHFKESLVLRKRRDDLASKYESATRAWNEALIEGDDPDCFDNNIIEKLFCLLEFGKLMWFFTSCTELEHEIYTYTLRMIYESGYMLDNEVRISL